MVPAGSAALFLAGIGLVALVPASPLTGAVVRDGRPSSGPCSLGSAANVFRHSHAGWWRCWL